MPKYNVIQRGSQREVLIGTVDAKNAESAETKAYQEYSSEDDVDYNDFRVESVSGTVSTAELSVDLIEDFDSDFKKANAALASRLRLRRKESDY